jgi:hypothetical protein
LSIDKNRRHRGKDARDSPLLGEGDAVAEGGDVVIGGEQGDQAYGQAREALGDAETIKAEAATGSWCAF